MSYRPVSGESFCGREAQLEALVQAARAGRPAAVAGRIGRGVSSMALQTVSRLRAAGLEPVLVDLSDLADEGDLDGRLPSAPGPGATGLHLLVDDADRLTAGGPAPAARAALEEVAGGPGLLLFGHDREALGRLAGGPDLLELELAPLSLAAWLPHALERFLETEVWVANEHVERVYELVGGHPRYLQEASRELWDLAAAGRRVEAPMVQEAVDRVAAREARAWRELWGSLTPNQRRFLRGVARAGWEPHPFGAEFLEASGLGTASSAQRAAASLLRQGLLEETSAGLWVGDPLLRQWAAGD